MFADQTVPERRCDMRIAAAAVLAVGLATVPRSGAKADCSYPFAFPFCVAGAAVATSATIATAPLYVIGGGPYYYGSPYYYGYHTITAQDIIQDIVIIGTITSRIIKVGDRGSV
jgi:hypothetical protein